MIPRGVQESEHHLEHLVSLGGDWSLAVPLERVMA